MHRSCIHQTDILEEHTSRFSDSPVIRGDGEAVESGFSQSAMHPGSPSDELDFGVSIINRKDLAMGGVKVLSELFHLRLPGETPSAQRYLDFPYLVSISGFNEELDAVIEGPGSGALDKGPDICLRDPREPD